MRIDPENESLHISQIAEGLGKLKNLIYDANAEPLNIEVTAMEAAINTYANIQAGILPILYSGDRIKECCHYVASAMDLVRYFAKITDKRKLKQIKGHLKLIGTGGFGIYATYQKILQKDDFLHEKIERATSMISNKEIARDAARKSIELMLALACLNKFDGVILEDPNHSSDKNPNPDLIVSVGEQRYGIACKSISSNNKANFREHIEKSIEQLEKAIKKDRVDPGRGVVFVDISALLDHDELFEPAPNHCWYGPGAALAIQAAVNRAVVDLVGEGNIHKKFNAVFKGYRAAPCIVMYAHSLMISENRFGVFPHYYKPIRVLPCGDYSKVSTFLDDLNDANHCQ